MNPDDIKRDQILRFLHERHKTTRGILKIPIGIRDLQSEMKKRHEMKQNEVSSNLDYLVQVGWVRDVTKERSFKTKGGMELSSEQVKYKISDIGINHLESGTAFRKPDLASHVNITNIKGVTVVGDGNVVNTELTDLSRALDELQSTIQQSSEITDPQRLEALADVSTIRDQISKTSPTKLIVLEAWKALSFLGDLSSVHDAFVKVYGFLSPFF